MKEKVLPIKRALISVSDKTNVEEIARFLASKGVKILSTGGTAKLLRQKGVEVEEVSDYTNSPEILGGRVKTLVPKIHGGILGRRDDPTHQQQMKEHHIEPIDCVIVNLYPFEKTVAQGADRQTCIENIDIGGPAMIRAAAKNAKDVVIVTDPADYRELEDVIEKTGGTSEALRIRFAMKAFTKTAAYDGAIAHWFNQNEDVIFPKTLVMVGKQEKILRYGENPHQKAAFYKNSFEEGGIASSKQLHGKELSYNNINDTDAAFSAVNAFEKPAIVIVKHANPCGIAENSDLVTAWREALRCDPVSAYGGIVACNKEIDAPLAKEMSALFLEVVIAPSFTQDALDILQKKKNLRLLQAKTSRKNDQALTLRSVSGGFLLQTPDEKPLSSDDFKVVTKRKPTAQEKHDLAFAFKVVQYVHSNAIIFAKDEATLAIGAGQMSRVDSARIAVAKSQRLLKKDGKKIENPLKGSVAASDAFFPFPDGLDEIIQAGATAVIQPGGSIRDEEVIAAADAAGITMVFTGIRHFLH